MPPMTKHAHHPGREDKRGLVRIRDAADFARHFNVSRETLADLELYAALLARWQKVKNLVAPGTLDDVWQRHFADSAQLLALAPDARVWLDLGTGAGFPGLVVAIMRKSDSQTMVHLVESNARKCAFLRDVARQTGAAVEIHNRRIESLSRARSLAEVEIVTARALTPLPQLLKFVEPFVERGARALLFQGARAGVPEARPGFRFRFFPSITEAEAGIIEVGLAR